MFLSELSLLMLTFYHRKILLNVCAQRGNSISNKDQNPHNLNNENVGRL